MDLISKVKFQLKGLNASSQKGVGAGDFQTEAVNLMSIMIETMLSLSKDITKMQLTTKEATIPVKQIVSKFKQELEPKALADRVVELEKQVKNSLKEGEGPSKQSRTSWWKRREKSGAV